MKKLILGALALLSMSWALAAVNINTAGADELKALPGIGPAKAEAIVEYRKQHGNFKSVEELKNVKGIGDGIYNRLKDEATVSGAPAKKAQPAVKKKAAAWPAALGMRMLRACSLPVSALWFDKVKFDNVKE